jgi:4-hydroxy-2-oxoheptanedioate aldolase
MVQFGPADYSFSIGVPGQRDHPAVREAERHMIETARKHGVLPRAELHAPEQAEPYATLGVRHFCMGTDVRTLFTWYREQGGRMREFLASL